MPVVRSNQQLYQFGISRFRFARLLEESNRNEFMSRTTGVVEGRGRFPLLRVTSVFGKWLVGSECSQRLYFTTVQPCLKAPVHVCPDRANGRIRTASVNCSAHFSFNPDRLANATLIWTTASV